MSYLLVFIIGCVFGVVMGIVAAEGDDYIEGEDP